MLRRVYPNWRNNSRFAIRIVGLLLVPLIFNVRVCAHTTENAIPLTFLGFSSPFGVVGDSTYTDVWGEGHVAYLGSSNSGVGLIDISDPSKTSLVDTYRPDAQFAFDTLQVHDEIGYWASSNGGGLHIVDVKDNQPQMLSTIGADNGASDSINGFAIAGDLLFASDAGSDLIFGYDISNRNDPQLLGSFATGDSIANHDILISGDYLFAAGLGGRTGDGTTYTYDISDFRVSGAVEVTSFETGDSSAFLAKTDNGMLVVTQRRVGGGLEVWDVSDPSSPSYLTRANASDFGLNAFSTGEVFVLDEIAYVAWHQEGVQSLDLDNVRTSAVINRLGKFDTSPNTSPLSGFIGNTGLYVYDGHSRVLLSDSRWGLYILDAAKTLPLAGDFDGNGRLTVEDLDALTNVVKSLSHADGFDLNGDNLVDGGDRVRWIFDLFGTTYGDSNLDGVFNSSDLIVVFQPAEYEDDIPNNSTWTTGDWNGDGDFSSSDIILAFQSGSYAENAVVATMTPVPEPEYVGPLLTVFLYCMLLLTRFSHTER